MLCWASLIKPTLSAPSSIKQPDTKIMVGKCDPNAGKIAKLATEATICGKQIDPLNRPK